MVRAAVPRAALQQQGGVLGVAHLLRVLQDEHPVRQATGAPRRTSTPSVGAGNRAEQALHKLVAVSADWVRVEGRFGLKFSCAETVGSAAFTAPQMRDARSCTHLAFIKIGYVNPKEIKPAQQASKNGSQLQEKSTGLRNCERQPLIGKPIKYRTDD